MTPRKPGSHYPDRRRPYTPEDLSQLRVLAEAGVSQLHIAETMNRSLGSIAGTVIRAGIKTAGGPGGVPSHRNYRSDS